jgi:archaetidylinositol phosphate synthase
MVVCPESEKAAAVPPPASLAARARKDRAHRELLTQRVYAPIGRLLVALLVPLRISPIAIVLANGAAGLLAAAAIARGDLIAAAVLLQAKSILDNVDGQLARATGRTTALGRYLDTEVDLLVNAAVFAALAYATDAVVLACAAFVAVTLILSADFNADVLRRRVGGSEVVTEPSAAGEGAIAQALARVYRLVYSPQDRVFQAVARRRLDRLPVRVDPDLRRRVELAYHDRVTVAILSNLGLSTQLAALGLALLLGVPELYLWLTLAALALLPVLQLRRERLARRISAR